MWIVKLFFFVLSAFSSAQEPPLEPPYTRSTESRTITPLEKPDSISDDGEYFYSEKSSADAIHYDLDHLPPITGAVYFRVSSTGAYDITGDGGRTYKQVYGENPGVGIVFDYEWQMFHLLGKWTAKFSTGFTVGNGSGQFTDPANSSLTPQEKFLLVLSPHTALLNYKMRFSDTQWFIPYVEGGPGYYTYIEHRNDGKKTAFGGAPVIAAAGGILVSMSLFDKNAAGLLYDDYGINHMWLDLNFRHNEGLDKDKDFSSDVFSAGFGFAF
ncbi:MAG: hypothetical protein IT287_01995 [Bdellovibrionaceae bacterium]|nr:hypothetical protein [Pseudobdellovibrionaceae bacterium]